MGTKTETPVAQGLELREGERGLVEHERVINGEAHVSNERASLPLLLASVLWLFWCFVGSNAGADAVTVQVLCGMLGGSLALLLRSPRPVRGQISARERVLRITRGGRVREVGLASASVYAAATETTLCFEAANGARYNIQLSHDEAERALAASGVDVLQSKWRLPVGWGRWAAYLGAGVGASLGSMIVALVEARIGSQLAIAAWVATSLLCAWVARLLTRGQYVEQGIDGVVFDRGVRSALSWRSIVSVRFERAELEVQPEIGAAQVFVATAKEQVYGAVNRHDRDALLFMGRVERAFAQSRSAAKLPEWLTDLARTGRSCESWFDALIALSAGATPFRSRAVEFEWVERALVHPHAAPEVRVACAVLLCAKFPDEWRARVRRVSDACVFEGVRAALRAVSDGASRGKIVALMEKVER